MKKFYLLLLSVTFLSVSAFSQCAPDVNVVAITHPTFCRSSDGGFDVQSMGITGTFNITIDTTGGTPITVATSGNTSVFTGLAAGLYHIKIVNQLTPGTTCDSFDFILSAPYDAGFTQTPTSATGCQSPNGSLLIAGVAQADSIAWISDYYPTYSVVSSLSGGNTITGLMPGLYYVTVKSDTTDYCYTTDTVTVGNTGTACPAATFCGTAADTTNLFPDGTFGEGPTLNYGTLPVGKTEYQYQAEGPYSPEDGFYAIANNTYVGAYTSYHGDGTQYTPFDGGWAEGWDHDHWTTGIDSGYMMIVNADFAPNIVIEDTVSNLCIGKTYQFSAWIRSLNTNNGTNEPANETFLVNGIGYYNTGNLYGSAASAGGVEADWHQAGFTFVPSATTAVFSLRNNAPGGEGNDFAIDDIYVGSCVPNVSIMPLPSNLCAIPQLNDSALVVDSSSLFQYYQWQVDKQDGNGYQNVAGGAQTGVFGTVGTPGPAGVDAYYATTPLPIPLIGAGGWTYRVIVATNPVNLSSPTCSFTSLDSSTLPTCTTYPLPVTFISIKAQLNNTVGDVSWEVGDQSNVTNYIVEKSTDQVNFTDVTTVPPIKGSSILNYKAADYTLAEGTTYYRIEAVDIDGDVSYSPTAVVTYGGGGTITVVNPVTNVLMIHTPASTIISQVVIQDAIGRIILEQDGINSSDPSIAVSTLTPGFYNLKVVSTDGTVTNLSFIKK